MAQQSGSSALAAMIIAAASAATSRISVSSARALRSLAIQARAHLKFRTFRAAFIDIPCQIVRTARTVRWRVQAWNPTLGLFFRLLNAL